MTKKREKPGETCTIHYKDGSRLRLISDSFKEEFEPVGIKIWLEKQTEKHFKNRLTADDVVGMQVITGGQYKTLTRIDTNILDKIRTLVPAESTNTSLWAYRWWGKPLSYLLSGREREEWIGDLLEIQEQMILEDRYPVMFVNAIVMVKGWLLIWVKAKCEFIEIVSSIIGKFIG